MPIFGMSRDHNRKRLKTRTEWIVFEIQQNILPKHGIIYNLLYPFEQMYNISKIIDL